MPYHNALQSMIDTALNNGVPPMLMSVHSFTDRWKAQLRPWEIGILWDKDSRLPHIFLDELAKVSPALSIGDNEPYSGRLIKDSMYTHATLRGLAHVLIEIRQDLIREPEGQDHWGALLTNVLNKVLQNPEQLKTLRTQKDFGSYILAHM